MKSMISPRSGHGYAVPVGIFEAILFATFFHPWLALGVLIGIIALVFFVRYLWKHLRWQK